jgi:hypothetical protein
MFKQALLKLKNTRMASLNMTFLKKLGQIISTVAGIFTGFAPFLTKTLPQTGQVVQVASQDLAAIMDEVSNIEAIGQLKGMTGSEKAKLLGPIVANIVLASAPLTNKKVADQALFLQGCQEIGGGVADVLNALHEESVSTVVTPLKS